MTHQYHDRLPGFHSDQILFDQCKECEFRGKNLAIWLGAADDEQFARAWNRAEYVYRAGPGMRGRISYAESELLDVLYGVRVRLERLGL